MHIEILSPEDVFTYEDGVYLFGRDEHTLFIEGENLEENLYLYYRGTISNHNNFFFYKRVQNEDEWNLPCDDPDFIYWVTDAPEHFEMLPELLAAPTVWAESIIEAVSTPIGYIEYK